MGMFQQTACNTVQEAIGEYSGSQQPLHLDKKLTFFMILLSFVVFHLLVLVQEE